MRYLAFDIGAKRTGVAVTDPLGLFAQALTTLPTNELIPWLLQYSQQETLRGIVLGFPKNAQGNPTDASPIVFQYQQKIKKQFPLLPIHLVDESFSSVQAMQTLIQAGTSKKKRREKGLIDKVAAVHILQRFLAEQTFLP